MCHPFGRRQKRREFVAKVCLHFLSVVCLHLCQLFIYFFSHIHRLLSKATHPSPLKAIFSVEELEAACLAVCQYLASAASAKRMASSNDQCKINDNDVVVQQVCLHSYINCLFTFHSGPENFKKVQVKKKLVKSNKSISWNFF